MPPGGNEHMFNFTWQRTNKAVNFTLHVTAKVRTRNYFNWGFKAKCTGLQRYTRVRRTYSVRLYSRNYMSDNKFPTEKKLQAKTRHVAYHHAYHQSKVNSQKQRAARTSLRSRAYWTRSRRRRRSSPFRAFCVREQTAAAHQ